MNTWSRKTITDFLISHSDTLRKMGVRKIGLFGSYARNEQTQHSDIDLLFVMDDFTFASWMDVWNYLEDNLGCKIDLVPEKDLRDELRPTVLSEVEYVEVA
jgi:predicted nucleotidyltransferase